MRETVLALVFMAACAVAFFIPKPWWVSLPLGVIALAVGATLLVRALKVKRA